MPQNSRNYSLTINPKARVTRHHFKNVILPDHWHPEHDPPANCKLLRAPVQQVSVHLRHCVANSRRYVLLQVKMMIRFDCEEFQDEHSEKKERRVVCKSWRANRGTIRLPSGPLTLNWFKTAHFSVGNHFQMRRDHFSEVNDEIWPSKFPQKCSALKVFKNS